MLNSNIFIEKTINMKLRPNIQMSICVSDKPNITLEIGRSLDLSKLEEGMDAFFVCKVDANPPPYKVRWLHNVSLNKYIKQEIIRV